MSENFAEVMPEHFETGVDQAAGSVNFDLPPVTGHEVIDQALAEIGDLSGLSATERLARLTSAQESLVRVLDDSRAKDDQMPLLNAEASS